MNKWFKNAYILGKNGLEKNSIVIKDGHLYFADDYDGGGLDGIEEIDCEGLTIAPSFVDPHVHLREPGASYKETIKSGTEAAAKGGYSHVFSMPNVSPAPATLEGLQKQLDIIKEAAVINVLPYGTITSEGNGRSGLSDMECLAAYVRGFSDDGRGVQERELMKAAMLKAKELDRLIVAHCEDESLLKNGYIHDGEYARIHRHRGICSESEWGQVERDVALAKETGCSYHVCHISAKETVDIIRRAKSDGVDVSCETAPHYLILTDMDLKEEGRFKMNPPIRSIQDRAELLRGIADGTIDMIATDHAPHSADEKSGGLEKSLFGIVGLEIAFSLLYTYLVKKGIISLERLVELMSYAPAKRFKIPEIQKFISHGMPANITILDLNKKYIIDPESFVTMGRATPFGGYEVQGEVVYTVVNGKTVYSALSRKAR